LFRVTEAKRIPARSLDASGEPAFDSSQAFVSS